MSMRRRGAAKVGALALAVVCLAWSKPEAARADTGGVPSMAQPQANVTALFLDARFAAPQEQPDATAAFALTPEMRAFAQQHLRPLMQRLGPQHGLVDALYDPKVLKLHFAQRTSTPAQTFAQRAGNCVSLVLMTAAFARELGVPVRFNEVMIDLQWRRTDQLHIASRHVNLTLRKRLQSMGATTASLLSVPEINLTVDFVAIPEKAVLRTRDLRESTMLAMYLNNRAAELLMDGRANDAYWWAREAIRTDPADMAAFNTLAVIYQRAGWSAPAYSVLQYVLTQEPDNVHALRNMVRTAALLNQPDEAARAQARAQALEPIAPFFHFEQGLQALRAGDAQRAVTNFRQELARDGDYHESHFWLANAYVKLGQFDAAREHLRLAAHLAPLPDQANSYAQKLSALKRTIGL
jgi:Tfp pilus assembly protein PilF